LERGFFSREYFPDYEIPIIEHTPWQDPPIRIPKAIEAEVRRLLEQQIAAGKFEPCTASYRCTGFDRDQLAVSTSPLWVRLVSGSGQIP
jgi:hypothetical protein